MRLSDDMATVHRANRLGRVPPHFSWMEVEHGLLFSVWIFFVMVGRSAQSIVDFIVFFVLFFGWGDLPCSKVEAEKCTHQCVV
jgi:hypothetical protein